MTRRPPTNSVALGAMLNGPAAVAPMQVSVQTPHAADLALLLAQPLHPTRGLLSPWVPAPTAKAAPSCNPLRHPEANREIVLNGLAVAYHFAHGQRRTIGMRVDARGLHVRAPRWATQAQVSAVLHDKASWIVAKLQQVPRAEVAMAPLDAGQPVPVLGRCLWLESSPTGAGRQIASQLVLSSGPADTAVPDLILRLGLPAGDARWTAAIQAWLQALAWRHFKQRLDHFAPGMGVRWQQLRLSNARTRWGSASSNGTIRLHWRLIQMAPEVLDYVVVHELAHLREMNHSPRFWAVVRESMPDYEIHRRALKQVRLATMG